MAKQGHQQAPPPVDGSDLVTKTYGDANYTTDANAIHDNVAAEISAVTEKASPVSADLLLIEDSADSNNKKRVQVGNLPGGTDANAIHKNVAAEISTVTEKASPISADLLLIEDSADSNNKKRVQLGNLPFTATGFGSADFLYAGLSSAQTGITAGDRILFDTVVTEKSGGDLALDTVTNVGRFSGLKAGRTYLLMSSIQGQDDTPSACNISSRWYNVTGAASVGTLCTAMSADYSPTNGLTSLWPAFYVFSPSVDTSVEVRVAGVDPSTADIWDNSWAAVFELAGPQIGASTETLVNTIRAGDVASHNSATPLVVSQFAFDPSEYSLTGATRSLVFRAVAANGGGVAQTKARLYSVTDTEYIGTGLTFTTAAPAKQQETLTIGSGAGEVDDSEKIYEVHIWVVSPDLVDDTIELGSAELRMINTVD